MTTPPPLRPLEATALPSPPPLLRPLEASAVPLMASPRVRAVFDTPLPDGMPVTPFERAWTPSLVRSPRSRRRKSLLLIPQRVLQRAEGVEFCFHTIYDGKTSVLETEFFHPTVPTGMDPWVTKEPLATSLVKGSVRKLKKRKRNIEVDDNDETVAVTKRKPGRTPIVHPHEPKSRQCCSCQSRSSAQQTWRTGWEPHIVLCNQCGLRYNRNGHLYCTSCNYVPTKTKALNKSSVSCDRCGHRIR